MKKIITAAILVFSLMAFTQNYTKISGSGSYKHSEEESIAQAKEGAAAEAHRNALVKYINSISESNQINDLNDKVEELLGKWDEITSEVNYTRNEYNPQINTLYSDVTARINVEEVRNVIFAEPSESEKSDQPEENKTKAGTDDQAEEEETATRPVKYREEDLNKKSGFNIVFGGGFNLMKSWEDHPTDKKDSQDMSSEEIPGAGLIGLRVEYDFGQFMHFPHTMIYAGASYPITIIGKLGRKDEDTGDWTDNEYSYEYSHTTFVTEFGLSKKYYVVDEFAIFASGAYVLQNMSLNKQSSLDGFNEDYKLHSSGFKGSLGMIYNINNAWFFETQASYTSMEPLKNDKDQNVFSDEDDEEDIFHDELPYDEVKEDEYLVPNGFSLKIGLGLRI
ncbi:MAG: hypothetical protein R6V47_06195 [Candidatus Delongbacteria bacterium]